jgi:CheY-like chemotaxis protein
VVLMDIAMPRTDGYQVARRIRALPQGGAIVALTGFARDDDVCRSKDEAFESHLVKPVDPKELDRLLKRLLTAEPAAG